MSKSFEIEGKLKVVDDIQTFASGFSKREFVVEVEDGRFPQMIKFECVKEKTALTDGLEIEDAVKVTFDIRGNEYKERYYVNLNAWKLEKVGASGGGAAPPSGGGQASTGAGYSDEDAPSTLSDPPADWAEEEEDDIPF